MIQKTSFTYWNKTFQTFDCICIFFSSKFKDQGFYIIKGLMSKLILFIRISHPNNWLFQDDLNRSALMVTCSSFETCFLSEAKVLGVESCRSSNTRIRRINRNKIFRIKEPWNGFILGLYERLVGTCHSFGCKFENSASKIVSFWH